MRGVSGKPHFFWNRISGRYSLLNSETSKHGDLLEAIEWLPHFNRVANPIIGFTYAPQTKMPFNQNR